jgi:hypothetical protein
MGPTCFAIGVSYRVASGPTPGGRRDASPANPRHTTIDQGTGQNHLATWSQPLRDIDRRSARQSCQRFCPNARNAAVKFRHRGAFLPNRVVMLGAVCVRRSRAGRRLSCDLMRWVGGPDACQLRRGHFQAWVGRQAAQATSCPGWSRGTGGPLSLLDSQSVGIPAELAS